MSERAEILIDSHIRKLDSRRMREWRGERAYILVDSCIGE